MGKIPLLSSSKSSLTILLVLSIVFFLENFDRLISGTLFAVFYSVGAVMITLMGSDLYGSSGGQISSFVMYLTISGVIFSVAFACTALTTTFYQLAIIRIVMGLAQSVVSPYSTGVINLLFNEESRATAFGVFNYGVYLAFSLALSVGTIIYDMYGWKANYLIFGCLGVVFSLSIPFIAYFEHDPPADHGSPGRLSVSHEQLLGSSDDTSPSPAPATRTFNERMAVAWSLFCTILKHCYDHGQWYLLFVLACGLRTGAGYVWVTYTAIYFSELFVGNGDDCSWSYNSATSDNACASDYPYCIDGECQALADTPWHNEGLSHQDLENFMSWIPLVGSAMGSILGGLVTDYCNSKSREPVATLSLEAEDREKSKEETYHPLHGSLEKTTSSPSPPPLPASYSWMRYAEQYFQGAAGRSLVSGLGILLAIPFVYLALVLSFPGCFLVFIVSGLFGEAYIGLSMTLLTELYALTTAAASHEIPLVPLVAIVNLFVNIIAGNMPLLIPAMMSAYQYMPNHLFEFYAAPVTPVNDPQAAMVPILYTVTEQGAIPLKYSMITVLCGLYGLSGILFLVLGMRLRSHAATKLPST